MNSEHVKLLELEWLYCLTSGQLVPLLFRLDNIVMSRLYRPGSVAYVSKSGGMLGPQCQAARDIQIHGISSPCRFHVFTGPMS